METEAISVGLMGLPWIVIIPALIVFSVLMFVTKQYKRCPSNKILVVYGNVAGEKSAKCIHGGGTLIYPLVQGYQFLLLEPMTTEIDLKGALSKKNIRVNVPATFTFGISTNQLLMQNAAERLLELSRSEIITQANDIILGQLRLVIATLSIEEINQDREKFLEQINANVNIELNKIGLEVINVNIRDITDESGYIDAIGKKAAAEAINQAKVEVAHQEKIGIVGEAEASRSKRIEVAVLEAKSIEGENAAKASVAQHNADLVIKQTEAQKNQRVEMAALEAKSIEGENSAKASVAQHNADLVIKQAEAQKSQRVNVATFEAQSIEGENSAKASIAQYNADLAVKQASALKLGEVAKANAERDVLVAQKEKEEAKLKKEELARQEVEKLKMQVMADAKAEQLRRVASGDADAIKLKYFAEAEGVRAVLEAKALGYQQLLSVCDSRPEIATSLLMIEKIEDIVGKQVEAIKNIKFDKITVWDGGAGSSGGSTTANFMKDLIKSLPAMHELAAQAGIELPAVLGKVAGKEEAEKNQS
ncbi:flotillin [Alphaproteobacteria bacterium]|nr:flotillin [Alphaproteobacteria bacterium]